MYDINFCTHDMHKININDLPQVDNIPLSITNNLEDARYHDL